jgi:DNA-binding response OmpR family regulator
MDTDLKRPRIRVLLADPERQLLSAYRQFLETQGFDVATASSRKECLSKLTEWKPDVLVLEPETPNRWGEEIIARLNQSKERSIPVLILSKRDRQSIAYPVREYHVKPYSMIELVCSIHAAVDDPEWG